MDTLSIHSYNCPLCSRRSQGQHACPPLNNLELWVMQQLRRSLSHRSRG